jgi:hypothetical protein
VEVTGLRKVNGLRAVTRRAGKEDADRTSPLDWSGHVPAGAVETWTVETPVPTVEASIPKPRRGGPGEEVDPADLLGTPLARMVLARARARTPIALDVVTFTAACPGCGQDCEWVQERQDTKIRSTMNCPCAARDASPSLA